MSQPRRDPGRTAGVAALVLAALAYGGWSLVWPGREAGRWQACLGLPLAACRVPEGYVPILNRCPKFHDCRTDPPALRYASTMLRTHRGEIMDSYAYAVIALDARGRVVRVEIKRFYPTL